MLVLHGGHGCMVVVFVGLFLIRYQIMIGSAHIWTDLG